MRRLTWLVVALLLIRYAVVLVGREPAPAYAGRDALVLAGVGILLFLGNLAWIPIRVRLRGGWSGLLHAWPWPGRFLIALGVGLAVGAAFWIGLTDWRAAAPDAGTPAGITLSFTPTFTARTAIYGLWIVAWLAVVAGMVWPGGAVTGFRPRYRWELDEAGRQVRRGVEAAERPTEDARVRRWPWSGRVLTVLGLVVIVAAVVVRVAQLTELPPGCIGDECGRALALGNGGTNLAGADAVRLSDGLVWLIFAWTGAGLETLRLAAAVWSLALLPMSYALARLYTRAGGATLLVVWLAFSPWLLWLTRTSHEWIALPVWIALVLWAGGQILRRTARGWWGLMGMGLGALVIDAPEVRFFVAAWGLLLLLELVATARREGAGWVDLGGRVALTVAGAAVVAVPGQAWQGGQAWGWGAGAFTQSLGDVLWALLRPGPLASVSGPVAPLLEPLVGALILVGLAIGLRGILHPAARLLLTAFCVWLAAALTVDWLALGTAGALLPLLPLGGVWAAIAVDAVLGQFQLTWRPLVAPRHSLAGGLAVALVFMVMGLPGVLRGLERLEQSEASTVDTAMGQYLAECLGNPAETLCSYGADELPPRVFVPGSVLNSPNVRLLIGQPLDGEQVIALEPGRHLLPDPAELALAQSGAVPRGRVYFVPLDNPQLLELLQQIYPGAEVAAPPSAAGPTLFAVFRVAGQRLQALQGLQGAYSQGTDFVFASEADVVRRDGPLRFVWQDSPPVSPPFTVAWEGSLLAELPGIYEFALDMEGQTQPGFSLSLQLDERLVLDTAVGLWEQQLLLAQGPYRLRLYARVDDGDQVPATLGVRWRMPGGEWEDIPRHVLYSPPMPQAGLVGTYYASDQWQGAVLTQRKDFVLEPAGDLPEPYSVRWEGRIAVPRAGEYVFAVSGNGLTQLLVDGRFLLDYAPSRDLAADPGFAQAGIYLSRGWRTIEIRHAPDGGRSNLRILWQPPGSGPELLRSRYLLPIVGDPAGSVSLPTLPELWDARLGDDTFALTYSMDALGQLGPQMVGLPPANLPGLPVRSLWRFARCGSGPDQLNAPHGVAIDLARGVVYVADTGNQRIAVFDLADGTPLAQFTDDRFEEPTDLAFPMTYLSGSLAGEGESQASIQDGAPQLDRQLDTLYVLDAVGHPLFALDLGEANVTTGAGAQLEPVALNTGFYRPRGLAIDEAGIFWVADTGGGRVAAVGPDGELLTQMGGQGTLLGRGQPVGVTAVGGVRWAVTAEDGRLWQLDAAGSIPAIERVNTIDGPHLAALPNGSFLITDPVNRAFTLHAPTGEPLRRYTDPSGFIHPTGIDAVSAEERTLIAVVDTGACGITVFEY